MFTIRLHKGDGTRLVYAAHAYAISGNYINITRYNADRKEENIRFDVHGSPDVVSGPTYARIEVENSHGLNVDALNAMPPETRQQIAAAVEEGISPLRKRLRKK